jgi:predicted TIM-barrel fold metal-dependent hydrolase
MNGRLWDAHVTLGETTFGHLTPEALLAQMDQYGIRRALVALGEQWLAVDNRAGNDALLRCLHQWPDRLLGYATANPWFGIVALDELNRALDGGLCAIKVHPGRQGFALLETVATPIWELAAQRGIPVYVVTGLAVASTPLQLAELARRYPETPFIMGRSGRTDYGWLDLARAVRQAPNIFVETAYNLPGGLTNLIQTIGPERVLFASDAPNTNLRLELAKLDQLELDARERALLMGGNLARLLGMARNTTAPACATAYENG